MSDQSTHFINSTIHALIEDFMVHRQTSIPYHRWANGMVEAFSKVLENALTKVCNGMRDDWEKHVLAVLWAYRTTMKKLTQCIPFKLSYGKEAVMPIEFLVPSLCVVLMTKMIEEGALK